MRARLLGAALLAAVGGVVAIAPASAQLGLPTPPSLPTLPPLQGPASTPTPTPTPTPSVICRNAPVVDGVWYYADSTTGQVPPAGSITPTHWAPRDAASGAVIVFGKNFAQPGCTPSLTFDSNPSAPFTQLVPGTVPGNPSEQTLGILFTSNSHLPPDVYGGVTVIETDPTQKVSTSVGDTDKYVFAQAPTGVAFTESIIDEGATVNIGTAAGLKEFQAGQAGSIPNASTSFGFAGCDGQTLQGTAQPPSDPAKLDSAVSFQIPYTYCDGAVTATFSSLYDLNQSACQPPPPNAPAVDPVKCALITIPQQAGSIDVNFFVSNIAPTTIAPGGTLQVTGSGFGASGTGNIAGVNTPVQFWGDHLIYLTVPTSAKTGVLNLCRASGDQKCFQLITITVQAGAATGPPGLGSYGSSPTPGPNGSVVPYVPGFHAGGAHSGTTGPTVHHELTVAVGQPKAAPGADVDVTVTLVVSGKPVAGAPVTLSVLSAPGPDAKVTPGSGVTDASGIMRGIVRLSNKVGDHLILAQSGIYSDEVHVVGQTPAGASGTGLPFGLGNLNILTTGNPLVVWLSVATAALIALGVLVNINVLRRFAWAITVGRLIHRLRRPKLA